MTPRCPARLLARFALPCTLVLLWCVGVARASGQAPPTAEAPASAKTWVGRTADLDRFIEAAEVVSIKDIPVGVTKPLRCRLAPGGPVAEVAFKSIKPGRYRGFWESYKSEIAAYELDKALGLDMIPPTVEKRVNNTLGAAIMWVSPVKSFKDLGGAPTPPPAEAARWHLQLVRAKMFHDLIGNVDPNLGNWLVDPAWNLILIDHSRAFTRETKLVHELTSVDPMLWAKMEALTEDSLRTLIGGWIGGAEIKAMLKRRGKMAEVVARLLGGAVSSEQTSSSRPVS